MHEFLLRPKWKNDVLECVQEAGFSPLSFKWAEEKTDSPKQDYLVSVLRYGGSDFYFKFDRLSGAGSFLARFSPAHYRLVEDSGRVHSWGEELHEFRQWLTYLKEETAPDLWERIKTYAPDEPFIGTGEISNAPFSYSEGENIVASLDKLQAQIEQNFNLQGKQLAFVKRQIEYLKDGAKRLGRKDWINILISVIVNIALTLALDPQRAKLLWDLVKSCFGVVLPLPGP